MKNIVILGGGAAGWLTCLFLKKQWPTLDITVVEDPSKPPIIAGESGSYALNNLFNDLDIDIFQWVINTNAMPKNGAKFHDWTKLNHTFTHSIIDPKRREEQKRKTTLSDITFDMITLSKEITISDSYTWGTLIHENMVPFIKTDDRGYDAMTHPMFHFDSRANAAYLKKLGIERGGKLREGKFVEAKRDVDNGNILSLLFDDGTTIDGDFFFDCSGFAKLLLKGALDVKFDDYSQYFPASSVLGWWGSEIENKSYTDITALKNGWTFNINIRNRSGNGYIYDNSEISVDQAIEEIETKFGKKIEPIASFTYQPDLATEFWKNNVIGIGISTGFVEPLESNGLGTVVHSIINLSPYWDPENKDFHVERKLYNEEMIKMAKGVIDFLNLHYRGKRTDTNYWRKLKDRKFWTDRVCDYVDLWSNGNLGEYTLYSAYGFGSFFTVAQALELINVEKIKEKVSKVDTNIVKQYDDIVIPIQQEYKKRILNECYKIDDWKNAFYAGLNKNP